MTRSAILAISTGVLLSISNLVFADSDEPPLFVVATGSDTGDCQTAASPCQTLRYALDRVGKNGQIRVGQGSFEVSDVSDVVYMLSGAIDVRGSYIDGKRSTLIGAPSEFAAALESKGFRVVVDSKGINRGINRGISHRATTARVVHTNPGWQSNTQSLAS